MNNFNDLLNHLKKEDIIFNQFINSHFTKSDSTTYDKIELIKYFPIINRLILNQKQDLILVVPGKKDLAYLSSLFSSLFFFKKNYLDRLKNFGEWLKKDSIVSLCSSGKETGKIYKFLGQKNEDYVTLGLIKDNSVKIDQRIETLLQFYPIKDDDPISKNKIGKNGYFPKPTRTSIDELLNINTYGNTSMYQNKIIVLTEYYKSFKNFLDREVILNKEIANHYDNNLSEIIKCDQINEEGELRDKGAEPLILYTKDLNHIYSYSTNANNEQLVICDNIRKIHNNSAVFEQIKNLEKKFNFLIFAEENEYDEIKDLHKNSNFLVWKFDNQEIKKIVDDVKYESSNLNNFSAGRIFLKNKIHLNKKEIHLEVKDNIFNIIALHLKKIIKELLLLDEQNKDLIKDIMYNLHNKLYQLRDHIFGFPDGLKLELDNDIETY
ncbi:hypothetical protein OAR56_04010, partial [Pelagibacteraceae bacterium]|nr:hypothetical protein [Pelagibacteraceae bacterium]